MKNYPKYLFISILISLLSIIQSIFGIGVLVFGTPTLLLMGYDFITTLALLVPASMTISLLQIVNVKFERPPISYNLYFITIPSIAVGLYLAESIFIDPFVDFLIDIFLPINDPTKIVKTL